MIILVITCFSIGFTHIEKSKDKELQNRLNKVVNAYCIQINNLELAHNNYGVLADVAIPSTTGFGKFDGHVFFFAGGFIMSDYVDLGKSNQFLWANSVVSP